ncbi:DUF2029 domain-containing protein [Edaphobacter sp. HDX4]|uniref:glycosyltransferase family 87 protein n=1 Tax=Edaphobacter sp. HDX4 TaxID=2794064 RepID=UPI002FE635B8
MPKSATLTPSNPRQRSWTGTILLLICAFAGLYHLHTINRDFPSHRSDLQPVKIGIQATLRGENPYSEDVTRQIQRAYYGRVLTPSDHVNQMAYVYPPHTAVVLAFLAPFQWETARRIFLVLAFFLTAAAVPAWIRISGAQWRRRSVLIAVVGVLGSWPVIWALRLQQPTILVAALIAVACLLLREGHDTNAAVLLAFATIKPQLISILTLWLLLRAVLLRRHRFLLAFAATTGVLLAIGTYLVPGWLAQWMRAGADLLVYTHQQPTFQLLFGHWFGILLNLCFAAITLLYLWRARRCGPESPEFGGAVGFALAATLTLMPTDLPMIYNQILLVPGCIFLISSLPQQYFDRLARRIALALVGWGFLAQLIAAMGEGLSGKPGFWQLLPFENLLLPPALAGSLALTSFLGWQQAIRSRKTGRVPSPEEDFVAPAFRTGVQAESLSKLRHERPSY